MAKNINFEYFNTSRVNETFGHRVYRNTDPTFGFRDIRGPTFVPVVLVNRSQTFGGSYKMRKCESAKVNMYKMRKFDAKDFAFYTSAS